MKEEISIKIILLDPPGGVDYGLQKGHAHTYEIVSLQHSSSGDLHFTCSIGLKTGKDGNPDFNGPFVQGPAGGRFIYISIGTYAGQKNTPIGRRLKIPLTGITDPMIKKLQKNTSQLLETRIIGTAKDGTPACATPKPFDGWTLGDAK
jgi:hypothetical protein